MSKWNNVGKCEYPICDADEAVPVWVVSGGQVVEAWYRNPNIDDCWFESDTGAILDVELWVAALDCTVKPSYRDGSLSLHY